MHWLFRAIPAVTIFSFVDTVIISFKFTLTLLYCSMWPLPYLRGMLVIIEYHFWNRNTYTRTHACSARHIVKPGSEVKIAFSSHLEHHSRLAKWERAYLTVLYFSLTAMCLSGGILSLSPPLVSAGEFGRCTRRDVFCWCYYLMHSISVMS